jgi:hypothetical protein
MNTKRILILAYIATVLAISSLARASTDLYNYTAGHINNVKLDHERGVVSVEGTFSNPCVTEPALKILNVDDFTQVIQMVVEAKKGGEVCVAPVQAFHIEYNLNNIRSLIPGRVYALEFVNYAGEPLQFQFTAQDNSQNDQLLTDLKQDFQGKLAYYTDRGYVLKNGSTSVEVIAPRLPIEHFNEVLVSISGYAVGNEGSPAIIPTSVSATLH